MSSDDVAVFKALADENRMGIVRLIAQAPGVTASALLDRLDIAQSTLSHHMKVLTESGLVASRRRGKWTHYFIDKDVLASLDRFVAELGSSVPEDEEAVVYVSAES